LEENNDLTYLLFMQKSGTTNNKENYKDIGSFLLPPSGARGLFLLHLADTNLILSQRNAEWCGHGPVLEQDIAITNISLDLLGQARNFYQYAAALLIEPSNCLSISPAHSPLERRAEVTEDSLAYLRTEREFKNLLITELPKGDWAQTILRQFFFSAYQYELYGQLVKSNDIQLAAIAEKSIKEVTYHLRWSSEWVIRLGDGTTESHNRMLTAIENLWPYTGEFFIPVAYENEVIQNTLIVSLKDTWQLKVKDIFEMANLPEPENTFMQTGGKTGNHTEHLGFILAEMQYLQRMYPNATW
jgi:ring-1,2-phenylacetyl-CoA epoxidase subunit PaaC